MVADTRAMVPQANPVNDGASILERVITAGDLSRLSPADRVRYYAEVCASVGLNPLTKPFDYLTLNGKLVLYANKGCTDQLRGIKSISIDRAERDASDPEYATWLVTGHDLSGRVDTEIGSVSIKGLSGEARANATMKALTKGKRRLTLSLAGLGFLDETEVASIPSAVRADVDMETGELHRAPQSLRETIADRKAATTSGAAPASLAGEGRPVPSEPSPATIAEPAAPETSGDAAGEAAPGGLSAGELRDRMRDGLVSITDARALSKKLFDADAIDKLTDAQRTALWDALTTQEGAGR